MIGQTAVAFPAKVSHTATTKVTVRLSNALTQKTYCSPQSLSPVLLANIGTNSRVTCKECPEPYSSRSLLKTHDSLGGFSCVLLVSIVYHPLSPLQKLSGVTPVNRFGRSLIQSAYSFVLLVSMIHHPFDDSSCGLRTGPSGTCGADERGLRRIQQISRQGCAVLHFWHQSNRCSWWCLPCTVRIPVIIWSKHFNLIFCVFLKKTSLFPYK